MIDHGYLTVTMVFGQSSTLENRRYFMSTANDHNFELQQTRYFTAEDLEFNKLGRYSPAQTRDFEEKRAFVRESAPKYQKKGWIISLVFGLGACIFAVVLYFVGIFSTLQDALGSLFLPVMAGVGIFVALFVFVIAPRSYQSSVDMYQSMGNSLKDEPLGPIQSIEARANVYVGRSGEPRRGGRSNKVYYILEMDSIKFYISQSLMETLQKGRLYRAYVTQEHGAWLLLSVETLE
jgi:hypothetical protein